MADDDRTIRVRLQAEIGSYVDGMRRAAVETGRFGREVSGHGKAVKADVERVGHAALLMSAGVAAGLGLSVKAAVDWESAWAGVTKTVDGSASQLAELEEGLRNMAQELPATHGEIAAVAEAAGALGIQRGAIEGFTRVMIDLGETTNLTADQAANAMARIANVMQTPQQNIERMGSTLVALGNAGASTESEILELSNRLAAAGAIAGLTEADVLAFGSALSSVGIEAEAGGSAFSKVFTRISDAVKDGGDDLTLFARVAGVSAAQFQAAYEKDAGGAIESFISGLGRIVESGESVTPVLEALEFTDIRLANALKSAATSGELFNDQLELGRRAWEENTALATEAEKRYETFAAKAEMARNQLVDLGIDVGGVLLPALSGIIDVTGNVARGLGEMDGAAGTAATGLAVLSAGGLGVIGLLGTVGPKVKAFRDALKTMGPLGTGVANNLGKATLALGAVGVAVGVYTAILGRNAEEQAETEEDVRGLTDAIREQGAAVGELSNELILQAILEGDVGEAVRGAGTDIRIFTDALALSGDKIAKLDDDLTGMGALDELGDLATVLDNAGLSGSALADELLRLQETGVLTDSQMNDLVTRLADAAENHSTAAREARNLEEAERGAGAGADAAGGGQRRLGRDLGLTTEEAQSAEDAIRDLIDAYRASVDPLFGMLDALDRNREAQRAQAEAAAEGAERIAEAEESLAAAQGDLAEAREGGDAASIAAALDRVAEAEENLTQVREDAAITAEEQAAFNRDVAKSALDVEVAARELALAVSNGTVSTENAKNMLAEWVEQGRLSEDQARDVAAQFDDAANKADRFAGDYIASVQTHGLAEAITDLETAWGLISRFASGPIDLQVQAVIGGGAVLRSTGGVIGETGPRSTHPVGSDTVPLWGTPGEGVVNLRGMSLLGPAGLDALNSGRMLSAPSYATTDARAFDHSRTWAPVFNIADRQPRRTAGDVEFTLRRIALEASLA